MAKPSFPQKLYKILNAEDPEVISWSADGECFRIHDHDVFQQEILTRYFRHGKFSSFQRQLNLYGFLKGHSGPFTGAYHHPDFKRDEPMAVHRLKRAVRKVCDDEDDNFVRKEAPMKAFAASTASIPPAGATLISSSVPSPPTSSAEALGASGVPILPVPFSKELGLLPNWNVGASFRTNTAAVSAAAAMFAANAAAAEAVAAIFGQKSASCSGSTSTKKQQHLSNQEGSGAPLQSFCVGLSSKSPRVTTTTTTSGSGNSSNGCNSSDNGDNGSSSSSNKFGSSERGSGYSAAATGDKVKTEQATDEMSEWFAKAPLMIDDMVKTFGGGTSALARRDSQGCGGGTLEGSNHSFGSNLSDNPSNERGSFSRRESSISRQGSWESSIFIDNCEQQELQDNDLDLSDLDSVLSDDRRSRSSSCRRWGADVQNGAGSGGGGVSASVPTATVSLLAPGTMAATATVSPLPVRHWTDTEATATVTAAPAVASLAATAPAMAAVDFSDLFMGARRERERSGSLRSVDSEGDGHHSKRERSDLSDVAMMPPPPTPHSGLLPMEGSTATLAASSAPSSVPAPFLWRSWFTSPDAHGPGGIRASLLRPDGDVNALLSQVKQQCQQSRGTSDGATHCGEHRSGYVGEDFGPYGAIAEELIAQHGATKALALALSLLGRSVPAGGAAPTPAAVPKMMVNPSSSEHVQHGIV